MTYPKVSKAITLFMLLCLAAILFSCSTTRKHKSEEKVKSTSTVSSRLDSSVKAAIDSFRVTRDHTLTTETKEDDYEKKTVIEYADVVSNITPNMEYVNGKWQRVFPDTSKDLNGINGIPPITYKWSDKPANDYAGASIYPINIRPVRVTIFEKGKRTATTVTQNNTTDSNRTVATNDIRVQVDKDSTGSSKSVTRDVVVKRTNWTAFIIGGVILCLAALVLWWFFGMPKRRKKE